MKTLRIIQSLLFMLIAIFTISCTKKDEYKKYERNGEIVYPARADSIIVHSGNTRAQLSIVLGNDPLVKKVKVYWKNFQDSIEMNIDKVTARDTLNLVINSLPEGNYNFTIFTYDSAGHKSVGVTIAGEVYGATYVSSLNTRTLKSVVQSADGGKIVLAWGSPSTGETGTEISYTAEDGSSKKVLLPADTASITLSGYRENSTISFRSVFKPDSLSLDSYFSTAETASLPRFERQMDKSLFKALALPTDVMDGGYGWLMEFLWDGNYNPPGFATESIIPCWFTFDMGKSVSLNRMAYWQPNDRLYDQQSVKKFEVWGTNNPNGDGSWGNWTRLTTCESVKPSGLPVGTFGPDDVAYASAGEPFQFPAGLPKCRYLRIKVLEVWGDGPFAAMEELTFWTRDK